jgi:hypothetical protein
VGFRDGLDAVVKRKISTLCRESNPRRPARSLVIMLTELSRRNVVASFVRGPV